MQPVEIIPIQESLILRARGSELLILPDYIRELKLLKAPKDFSRFFVNEALVNRPARKLFEAWLRKDRSLWPRLFKAVHEDIQIKAEEGSEDAAPKPVKAKSTPPAPAKESKAQKPTAESKEKPIAKADESETKSTTKKVASSGATKKKKVAKAAADTKKAKPVKTKATAKAKPAAKKAKKKGSKS